MRINPFNPQIPARPDFFVGREPEIVQFEKFLNQTIGGSPMNMSITGNRGIGKTSLLVKFEQLAKEKNCLVIRLSNYEGNIQNVIDFTEFILVNLQQEYLIRKPLEESIENLKKWMSSLKTTIEWNDIAVSVEKKQIIQEIFRKKLLEFWNRISQEYNACVILIDEAESLEKIEGILPYLREVFQRIALETKYSIVLAGKLNFPERMSESFSPLNRFFPIERLESFKSTEVRDYIHKKLDSCHVKITGEALHIIQEESEGHPYVLVSMCYTIFDALPERETIITPEIVKKALPRMYSELEKDFFIPMYHPLAPKAKEILLTIGKHIKGKSFTFNEAATWTKLANHHLSPYILDLNKKGIINKPERGKYEFFHHLFINYILQK